MDAFKSFKRRARNKRSNKLKVFLFMLIFLLSMSPYQELLKLIQPGSKKIQKPPKLRLRSRSTPRRPKRSRKARRKSLQREIKPKLKRPQMKHKAQTKRNLLNFDDFSSYHLHSNSFQKQKIKILRFYLYRETKFNTSNYQLNPTLSWA